MGSRLDRRGFLRRAAARGAAMAGLALPAVLHAAEPGRFGDLVGRFLWNGPIPDRRKLKVDRDLDFCGKFDIRDESLMVGRQRGLANVYVYVRNRGTFPSVRSWSAGPRRE